MGRHAHGNAIRLRFLLTRLPRLRTLSLFVLLPCTSRWQGRRPSTTCDCEWVDTHTGVLNRRRSSAFSEHRRSSAASRRRSSGFRSVYYPRRLSGDAICARNHVELAAVQPRPHPPPHVVCIARPRLATACCCCPCRSRAFRRDSSTPVFWQPCARRPSLRSTSMLTPRSAATRRTCLAHLACATQKPFLQSNSRIRCEMRRRSQAGAAYSCGRGVRAKCHCRCLTCSAVVARACSCPARRRRRHLRLVRSMVAQSEGAFRTRCSQQAGLGVVRLLLCTQLRRRGASRARPWMHCQLETRWASGLRQYE